MGDINVALIFASFFSLFAPLFLVATGGLIAERSGVINIALEGMMVFGGLGYAITDCFMAVGSYTWLLAILIGMIFALFLGLIHAVFCVAFPGNQIVSGTGINFLGQGLGLAILYALTNKTNYFMQNPVYQVPFFNGTSIDVTFFVFISLILIIAFIYYQTKVGLRLRACGESPQTLSVSGISVFKYRFIAVLVSSMLAGAAGACYIGHLNSFSGTANGLGFIGLAILVLSRWKPFAIFLSSLFFSLVLSFAEVLGINVALQKTLPSFIFQGLPYFLTIVSLIIFSRSSHAPLASGQFYKRN